MYDFGKDADQATKDYIFKNGKCWDALIEQNNYMNINNFMALGTDPEGLLTNVNTRYC